MHHLSIPSLATSLLLGCQIGVSAHLASDAEAELLQTASAGADARRRLAQATESNPDAQQATVQQAGALAQQLSQVADTGNNGNPALDAAALAQQAAAVQAAQAGDAQQHPTQQQQAQQQQPEPQQQQQAGQGSAGGAGATATAGPDPEAERLAAEAQIAAHNRDKWARMKPLVENVLQRGLPSLRSNGKPASFLLHPMRRVHNVSSTEWEFRYGTSFGAVPTVVTGSQADWFDPAAFTPARLRALIGSRSIYMNYRGCQPGEADRETEKCHRVKEADPSLLGQSWAALKSCNLTELGITTYGEFLDAQAEHGERGHFMYAHDLALNEVPELAPQLRIPKFFLNNYADIRTTANSTARDLFEMIHFPSVFFGPPGSSSPLHSDGRMTRFWITQLQGRKLVRAVPPSENWKSYPTDVDTFQPSIFPVDLMFPDFAKHPSMNGMLVYEAILEPGDVLFMPEGWGHQALNLEWALMLTSNYVDAHNIVQHLDWNAAQGGKEETRREHEAKYLAWFLPMHSSRVNQTNLPILDYFHWHNLENAPVSQAAKHFVHSLETIGIAPDAWVDRGSTPLLISAVQANYVNLVKWLLAKGVSVAADGVGAEALDYSEGRGHTTMAALLRDRLAEAESANGEDDGSASD